MRYFIIAVSLLLSSCASYEPKPDPMKEGLVAPFQNSATVNVVNGQDQSKLQIERYGGVPVNLKATTEETIKLLEQQLSQNGVVIDPGASKAMTLSVQELYQFPIAPPYTDICIVRAGLTTSSGLEKLYSVKNLSGVDIFHACDFALTKLVAEIINDPVVRDFLDE